jgi:hypothetical protein
MKKFYFNAKKKNQDAGIANERRRLNNEAVKKFISKRSNKKSNGSTPWNK